MTEQQQPDLASQFRELGENLKEMFQSAWESEEVEDYKEDLRNMLTDLGDSANRTVEDFKISEKGQKIKAEAEDFKSRWESGEVKSKAHEEISKALDVLNAELQKARDSFSKPGTGPEA